MASLAIWFWGSFEFELSPQLKAKPFALASVVPIHLDRQREIHIWLKKEAEPKPKNRPKRKHDTVQAGRYGASNRKEKEKVIIINY